MALISASLDCFLKVIEELKEKEVYPDKKTELKEVGDEIEELFKKTRNIENITATLIGKNYAWEYKEENENKKNEGKFCKI